MRFDSKNLDWHYALAGIGDLFFKLLVQSLTEVFIVVVFTVAHFGL